MNYREDTRVPDNGGYQEFGEGKASMDSALTNKIWEDFQRSGLDGDDMRLMRVAPRHMNWCREHLGCHTHCYAIPYFEIGGRPLKWARYRKFGAGEGEQRYTQPRGTGCKPYFAPQQKRWAKILADPRIEVFITEGEKKAAAMCKAGFPCIGIGGKDSYGGSLPGGLFPEFIELAKGRKVTVILDSDTATKPDVAAARLDLCERLATAGADAGYCDIKHDGDEKAGLDDVFAAGGVSAIQEILEHRERVLPNAVSANDLWAHLPTHEYIYVPTSSMWPASSVDARLKKIEKKNASAWLDRNRAVEQTAWAPGEQQIIKDKLLIDGGWIERAGAKAFNLYRPPRVKTGGDATKASPWIDHVHRVYPSDGNGLIRWMAHRVQRPGEKINHALVLGGAPGIGKDTILEPVKYAIGAWNFQDVSPVQLLGRFNGFIKSVILRVSEARDLGDKDRFALYEHTKTLIAAPPDVLRCDEKNMREHAVLNVTGVVYTTNNRTNGLYLPVDDRRHYVAWSELKATDFGKNYFSDLYKWYASGGNEHIAAYLAKLKLSKFDPKAPPLKTRAFHAVVDANRSPEDAEVANAIHTLEETREKNFAAEVKARRKVGGKIDEAVTAPRLNAITLDDVVAGSDDPGFRVWLKDRSNRRQVPHRLEAAGWVQARNPDDKHDGQWNVDGKRCVVYSRKELSISDRIAAVKELQRQRKTVAGKQSARLDAGVRSRNKVAKGEKL